MRLLEISATSSVRNFEIGIDVDKIMSHDDQGPTADQYQLQNCSGKPPYSEYGTNADSSYSSVVMILDPKI